METGQSADGAFLDQKFIGDISGRFVVEKYQRGYRWGRHEVLRLLMDIWENGDRRYSLQPLVVKSLGEDEWELVDGQQRLTTLYLIFLYMQREGLQTMGSTYSIVYRTRPGSETYLQNIGEDDGETNIDRYHLSEAYACISGWFEEHGGRRQHVANKFYGYLFDFGQVLWYEASPQMDATELFTRLNVGRIPLTDAELVKALLLSRRSNSGIRADRAQELAAQWDAIERDLQDPDLWAFITDDDAEECPTHISLLLDTLAGGPRGRKRPLFHTFDELRLRVEERSPEAVWNEVVDLHALVMGWYTNRDTYHKIGYLISVGHKRFDEFVDVYKQESTKSGFERRLDAFIRASLKLSESDLLGLSYENAHDKKRCAKVLLLMNVETVRRMANSSERYSFRLHRDGEWSLEHIHAQHAEILNKVAQWQEWLRLHREALAAMPVGAQQREHQRRILERIDESYEDIDRQRFFELSREVTSFFSKGEESAPTSLHSVHSIANLALLRTDDNSALGNAVFEVKRRRILELDRKGSYIPVCTRRVFLKYYTGANAQQIHFWGAQDRESYLDAMISIDGDEAGVLSPYLLDEGRDG